MIGTIQAIAGSPKKPNQHDDGQDGFTLLEMLVVMTIVMAVFAGLSNTIATRNNSPSVFDLAKKVQKLVYRARSDAIGSGKLQSVWIDLENRQFSYGAHSPVQLPETVDLKITTGQELISASGRVELVFLADGSSSGMDAEFTEVAANPADTSSRKTAKLRINWLTGLPSILEVKTQ